MPAQPESYEVPHGRVFVAGGYETRPVLGAIGTSKISANTDVGTWTGQAAAGHIKWMNAFLRKPFDYVKLNGAMKNGFYGLSGETATTIEAACPAYVDAMAPLVGSRRCLIAINAEGNSLYGGTSAATVLTKYNSMIAQFAAHGWKSLVNEATPADDFNTVALTNNAVAFSAGIQALVTAINLGWMLNSFHDPADWALGLLNPLPQYTSDGKHLSAAGAVKIGMVSADVLSGRYTPWRPLPSDVVCSVNPTLSGTQGNKSSVSGVAPDGFTLSSSVGTVTGTQTADGYEIECVYSGAAFVSGAVTLMPIAAQIANVTVGETWHEAIADIEVVECVNFGFQVLNLMGGGTGYIPGTYSLSSYTTEGALRWFDWMAGRRLVLHSDPFIAPAGMTRSDAGLTMRPHTGATTASIKLRLRWLGVKQA